MAVNIWQSQYFKSAGKGDFKINSDGTTNLPMAENKGGRLPLNRVKNPVPDRFMISIQNIS